MGFPSLAIIFLCSRLPQLDEARSGDRIKGCYNIQAFAQGKPLPINQHYPVSKIGYLFAQESLSYGHR